MTEAGYGPHPERTFTWRRFWYAWLHNYLETQRQRRETHSFQTWLLLLQSVPDKAQEMRAATERADAAADWQMLVALHDNLPPSVRPLLGLRTIDGDVAHELSVIGWWDERIEDTAPGSRARAFWEAGKRAAQQRMHGAHGPSDEPQSVH